MVTTSTKSITISPTTTTTTTFYNPSLDVETLKRYIKKEEKHFSGKFIREDFPLWVFITKVIYSDPATIVFWNDGTKTVSKCHGEDTYSPETGLILCVLKKLVGTDEVRNLIDDWVMFGDGLVTIKEVRKKHNSDK